ncbi:MAG: hypothetical protein EOP94_00305 [Zymomonas sp.]|nr:MAG: hypothetical protein EOP94_00305 [Zymomonas sp.]
MDKLEELRWHLVSSGREDEAAARSASPDFAALHTSLAEMHRAKAAAIEFMVKLTCPKGLLRSMPLDEAGI